MNEFDDTKLYGCKPDGSTEEIKNDYSSIREYIGNYIELAPIGPSSGMYVNEEGMVQNEPLNNPASLFAGVPIYGPAVLIGPVNAAGDDTSPDPAAKELLHRLAMMWARVYRYGTDHLNQQMLAFANVETVPPPEVYELKDNETFEEAIARLTEQ